MKSLTRQKSETILYELTVFRINGTLAYFRAVITGVIEKRMSNPVEMDSDLVGTTGLKATFHDRYISETFKHTIMSHRMLAMVSFRKHLETHTVIGIPADGVCDGSLVFLEVSPHDCHITAFYGMHEKLLCKIQLSFLILCHD